MIIFFLSTKLKGAKKKQTKEKKKQNEEKNFSIKNDSQHNKIRSENNLIKLKYIC